MGEHWPFSIESYGGGYIVVDYSGNRGSFGAAYFGQDGTWNSQPIVRDPFASREAAEAFMRGEIEREKQKRGGK
jgi:viroplasmin and RNaseH domain-containing protein